MMLKQLGNKIKTVEELRVILGVRPRLHKVVMCHGMFDIVHPGHIRHLMYAKEQGGILIASLTSDEHGTKGEDRPYVPQDLRATNLAALEMVDYVLIDSGPDPLPNISELQPDYFVKGFEYSTDGVHPKTEEEMQLVSSYGGEFLFSPGDVVYSSTQLLAQHKPPLSLERLITLMDAEGISWNDLQATLNLIPETKVHIIGDTIVDKYSYCTLLGPSTDTPTFSVKLERSTMFLGGAGIVAKHMRALGADVTFTTVLGKDELSEWVIADLDDCGIRINVVHDAQHPTTMKERFWASNYKLLQVDKLDNSPLSASNVERVSAHIESEQSDLVVFSDFRHGLFHGDSINTFTKAIPPHVVKVADSQVSSRWGNILDFKGFDLITPNEREARFAMGDQDSVVRYLAQRLLAESDAKNMILKLGERGILTYRSPGSGPRNFFSIDSFVEKLVDPVGAGDALLATASLALVRSGDIVQSAILGNLAAAVACESEGNVPIPAEVVSKKVRSVEDRVKGPSI